LGAPVDVGDQQFAVVAEASECSLDLLCCLPGDVLELDVGGDSGCQPCDLAGGAVGILGSAADVGDLRGQGRLSLRDRAEALLELT
jgi:hypothetical protein